MKKENPLSRSRSNVTHSDIEALGEIAGETLFLSILVALEAGAGKSATPAVICGYRVRVPLMHLLQSHLPFVIRLQDRLTSNWRRNKLAEGREL